MTVIPGLNELRFATDPGRIDEPDEGKKDVGHVDREEPSPLGFNWWKNKTFERFKSLQGNESNIIIGTQAEKDDFVADLLVTEMSDGTISFPDKVSFLEGNHIFTASIILTANNLEFTFQSTNSLMILTGGNDLTLSGNGLRGELNLLVTAPSKLVISGSDIENLQIRVNDPLNIDFIGSGSITVNGKLINQQLTLLEISHQPDRVILTAAEQALFSNDDRFVRYDQTSQTFLRRDNTPVAINDGSWVVIKSLETLTNDLVFDSDRLRLESHHGFQLDLGNQGENIPWTVFIKGQNCRITLFMTQSVRELAAILGDDKFNSMVTNGLSSMENRRVIKNQGESNHIQYNGEVIFRGGAPSAHMDFVKPNHPYLLDWDNFIYDGLLRDLPAFPTLDNKIKCWFTDMYYWLDHRFNAQLSFPDTTIAYHTVTAPPRSPEFMRPLNILDPDRHSRTDDSGFADVILAAEYSQTADKIILGTNAADNIKKVKNGQRISATGIPGGGTDTTIVRPGSIVTAGGSESFLIMDAETNAPVTAAASGNLTLDFSGMASGSSQLDSFQNIIGSMESSAFTQPYAPFHLTPTGALTLSIGTARAGTAQATAQARDIITFDASNSPGARVTPADETRPLNSLGIPYYKL